MQTHAMQIGQDKEIHIPLTNIYAVANFLVSHVSSNLRQRHENACIPSRDSCGTGELVSVSS